MTFQAKVIYDFEAVGDGELTIRVGDIVTVTNNEVGQGWWMASGVDGKEGIIPEAYVERVPDIAGPQNPPQHPPPPLMRRVSETTSWGDDWDSDEEHRYEDPKDLMPQPNPVRTPQDQVAPQRSSRPNSTVENSYRPSSTTENTYSAFSLGKFSGVFGKSGAVSDYLTGLTESGATLAREAVLITEQYQGVFSWEGRGEPFTVIIGSPKKGSKFGGMKSFIAYQVTPSFSNIQVARRYKHFDWLHEQLTKKFGTVIAIPPLPEKQVTGRFEEDLIEHRRIELQSFADRICRHPVLASSEVWRHFLTETDDKKWTRGKRTAETDKLVGTAFLTTIQAPSVLKETEILLDDKIVRFGGEVVKLDTAVKNMYKTADDQIARFRTTHKKDYQDIGRAFTQLGDSLGEQAPCLNNIGACYEDLAQVMEDQVVKDWEPLQHLMHDYKGLTGGWQGILGFYGGVKEKQKEIEKSESNEKEKDSSVARVNTYRIGVSAEQNFFTQEMGLDINHTSQAFLAEQIAFHQQMSERLTSLYHSCWPTEGGVAPVQPTPSSPPQTNQQTVGLDAWGDQGLYEEVPH